MNFIISRANSCQDFVLTGFTGLTDCLVFILLSKSPKEIKPSSIFVSVIKFV